MLKSKTRWVVKETVSSAARKLVEQLNITPLVSILLVNRGIVETEEARSFLFMEDTSFHDPYLLFDMDIAVQRINESIANGEKILVFGDYDADGVSSTTVLMTVLKDLGAKVDFYIPNRFTEGYGPNEMAFRWAADNGYKLIITVDTGIAAINEALLAKELGMDLIITDHHEPGPELPEALAIVHPKHPESKYPFKELAGVGVAFKLAHALYGRVPEELLDVVTIGTVADLVPLHGENRLIVKKGLKKLGITERPGIRALYALSNSSPEDINEETVGFMLAPRLNAPGRLDHAAPAVELLLTDDFEAANEIAKEIDGINKERQSIVNDITKDAISMIEAEFDLQENKVIVIGKEGWNPGVIGIVASRLVERYYRPTIVLSFDTEKKLAKGSARSIVGFDLFQNLSTCRDILPHFGGHTMAAGMTLSLDDVSELRTRLNHLANTSLSSEDFIPITEIDANIPIEEVNLESIQELNLLAPYGTGNPKPKIMIEKLSISQLRQIGADNKHLKVVLEKEGSILDGVGFGMGDYFHQVSPLASVSVLGELAINEWNNVRKPQIFLRDMKIEEWQLFDFRGVKQWNKWIPFIPKNESLFIVFQHQTLEKLALDSLQFDIVEMKDETQCLELQIDDRNIVLLDLPTSLTKLEMLIKDKKPSRIYCHFFHEQDHYFSTIPTREHFKWFYGFLIKQKTFNVMRQGDQLAAFKGWSRKTIDFMSQVFFDLEFVTIEDGLISLKPVKVKRDLVESKTYQEKQQQITLENELLYSSYKELKSWFDERVSRTVEHEEEMTKWI
ncbi:single-stranded-DNA-specific exonuclease RecJ [Heyndrickxia shackletonii]|uniref:Single-stranded-DNA-specific exonuclease RecJ n=1 Tax=Heyndrickxia shackletonii TaxID=157838 RepID=A0A0Q3THE8_9BACI|nr:single-stranded-DNA-specific exonuclease RecJ [Heyndrickxia shackletonii]KQL53432.1 single-stranded-DNA-specific exonuclease RecJ [Heyndrickxia shackletonii]NEZ00006.1 single-stranded-DNA-specific exonuclease RecJ [Heyndrickxia shackletonii]